MAKRKQGKRKYQNTDPRGWVIRTNLGKVVEKGFASYREAKVGIRMVESDLRELGFSREVIAALHLTACAA